MSSTKKTFRSNLALIIGAMLLMAMIALISHTTAPTALAVPASPEWQILLDKANEYGRVRVIVGLDVTFTPEGELDSPQAVQAQQQAIQNAQNQVWQALSGSGSELIANFQYIPYMAVAVDAPALTLLAGLPQVINIQEDELAKSTLASSIPVIGADDAWAAGNTGAGQTIAILDTGVDKTHSFFTGGKVVSEACYSTTGSDQFNGTYQSVCPGGVTESTAPGSGIDCVAAASGYPYAQENCQHGTHVAGIAAGNPSSGPNIGVAKDSDIIAIQVFTLFKDFDFAASFTTDQIKGLERVYALRNTYDIAAVNMSLGGSTQYTSPCDGDSRKAIIDTLRSADIATIIASGNGDAYGVGYKNSMSAPACISTAVSVGATTDWDTITSFSNVANFLDFLAPGHDITSAIPGGGTAAWDGTSMAAPHVAGAWAVVRSNAPNASVNDVFDALDDTGTPVDDNRSGGTVQNIPRINVDLAAAVFNPVAAPDGAAIALNEVVTINVLANDYDILNDPLTIDNVGAAGVGTAVQVTSTSIQYTPPTDYSGADSFTYTISDSYGNTDTATVVIIIDGEATFLPIIQRN